MDIHADTKTKDLLHRYHAGKITPEEMETLIDRTNHSGDEELYALLREHWHHYNEYAPLPAGKKRKLYAGLQKSIHVPALVRLRRHWLQIAAAALLLLTGSLTVLFLRQHQEIRQFAEQSVVINAGDHGPSSVWLPDGTKVRLNTKSRLTYQRDFGRKNRKVELAGEGYFEVKRDEKKQFIVETGFMDVVVLGTTFNVYAYENKDFLEMALIEGSVRVTTSQPPYQTIEVKPNEKVTYNKQTGRLKLESTSNRIETAWMEKELVFRHDRLQEVFDCLERKFGVTFTIDDDRLLQDIYTGVFDDGNIEHILQVLRLHYGFEYTTDDNRIDIRVKK